MKIMAGAAIGRDAGKYNRAGVLTASYKDPCGVALLPHKHRQGNTVSRFDSGHQPLTTG